MDSGQSTEFDLLLNLDQFKEKFPNQELVPISAKCGTAHDKTPLIIEAKTCMNGYIVFNQGKTEVKTLPQLSIGLSSALSPNMPLLGNKALKTHSLSVHFFPTATVLRAGGEGFMQLGRLRNSGQGSRRVHRRAPKVQVGEKGTFVEPSNELRNHRSSSGGKRPKRAGRNRRKEGGGKGEPRLNPVKLLERPYPPPRTCGWRVPRRKGEKWPFFERPNAQLFPPTLVRGYLVTTQPQRGQGMRVGMCTRWWTLWKLRK